MRQIFDLHLHTFYSDGQYDVDELIENVRKYGIKCFSITDHDSVESIHKIKECDLSGLEYVKGIEVSSILDDQYKMHILGYHFDENNPELLAVLNELKERRKKRFWELVEYVEQKGNIKLDPKDVEAVLDKVYIPGKPHLAQLLVDCGYVSSVPEAFQFYLEGAKTKTSNRMSADIVISTIKKAGGKVIWAHPKKVEKQYNIDFQDLMPRLLQLGIDGIEIYNSLHSYDDCMRYLSFANSHHLLRSGGSDFHGELIKPEVNMGVLFNSGEEIEVDFSQIDIRGEEKFYG